MKVLWLTNIPLTKVAEDLMLEKNHGGGWLEGLFNIITNDENINLYLIFPFNTNKVTKGKWRNVEYFGFPQNYNFRQSSANLLQKVMEDILKEVNPDIIHIFGTEYKHTLAMTNAAIKLNKINHTLINIQGICAKIAFHYFTGLPNWVKYIATFRDLLTRNNIYYQQKKFISRSRYEKKAIMNVTNIIGRTDWDLASTKEINKKVNYYHCNEILRDEFYEQEWDISSCIRHSIFISQATYPIKGLHILLNALPEVIKEYPDTHLYISGSDITNKNWIKTSTYGWFLNRLIKKHNIESNITWLGILDGIQMRDRYLKSHVFASSSLIENESNSISEAKLLGVPVVASFVGGVTSRIKHSEDGFLYQHDASYMLSYYICKIFDNDKLAIELSRNSKISANNINDRKTNYEKLLSIYAEISIK